MQLIHSKMQEHVKPGDIILVRTPNVFYEAMRRLYQTDYDHAILVVDNDRCVHITYPRAKLVPLAPFLHKRRNPMVIRVTHKALSQSQRVQFISDVKHASVG